MIVSKNFMNIKKFQKKFSKLVNDLVLFISFHLIFCRKLENNTESLTN